MTASDIASIILASSTLLTAIGALVVAVRTSGKVSAVATAVDGHTERLVALTAKSSYAEGAAAQSALTNAEPKTAS